MNLKPVVFLVDDDAEALNSLHYLLESVGLEVECFPSAKQFLEAYDPQRPACLVLDVRMPEMDGLALQERLGRRGEHLPIIFVTGHGDVPSSVQAMKGGAVDFVGKACARRHAAGTGTPSPGKRSAATSPGDRKTRYPVAHRLAIAARKRSDATAV